MKLQMKNNGTIIIKHKTLGEVFLGPLLISLLIIPVLYRYQECELYILEFLIVVSILFLFFIFRVRVVDITESRVVVYEKVFGLVYKQHYYEAGEICFFYLFDSELHTHKGSINRTYSLRLVTKSKDLFLADTINRKEFNMNIKSIVKMGYDYKNQPIEFD